MDAMWSYVGAPALDGIVRSLTANVLTPAYMPQGRTVAVTDVSLYDPTDAASLHDGAIVLGLGVLSRSADALELLDAAGAREVAAVVLSTDGHLPSRLVGHARRLDIALLAVAPEVGWGHLYSLLRAALNTAGALERSEASGVPEGDLFALADATAAAVGGAVTIEDPHWRVLAYSNLDQPIDEARRATILGRVPPHSWQRRIEDTGIGRALRAGQGVEMRLGPGLARRIAAPVRAGDELLASIWVAEGAVPLDESAERELLRIAERASVHLISHRASEDVRRRTRGAAVREILEGRVGARVDRDVTNIDGPFTVIAFEPSDGTAAGPPAINPERVLNVIALYCESLHPDAMCARIGGRFWTLLPLAAGDARERAAALAETVIARLDGATPVRLNAGIGGSVPRVADVPRSRRGAARALRVLADRGDGRRVVHIADVQSHAALLELIDLIGEHDELRGGRLADLLAREPQQADQHRETLRAYLDHGQNVARAAEALDVHPNTLRYRVRRLLDLSKLNLDDPDERLVTELQLRLPPAKDGRRDDAVRAEAAD